VNQNPGLNLTAARPLPSPSELHHEFPATPAQAEFVHDSRNAIRRIMLGLDRRLVVVVGPCSIHDVNAGYDYASRLAVLARELDDRLLIVMRAYFEKPRTALGWPGLVFDPSLDESGDVARGLRLARHFLSATLDLELPTGTEFLDPLVPHYLADVVCWAAIGARTAESQPHRQLASGLAMPVGFKNGTDGRFQSAVNAINAARRAHTLVGLSPDGRASSFGTRGNPDGHIVLRGGATGPNFSSMHVSAVEAALTRENLPRAIMVDCSHDNSGRRPEQQTQVLHDVLGQIGDGNRSIFGVMLESNLGGGRQPIVNAEGKLRYGVSVTDGCLDWSTTEACLRNAHASLAGRFDSGARRVGSCPTAMAVK
jgi:3-deoxy-7-phosphoheptulonate synthase